MGTNVYAIRKNPRELRSWKKLEQAVDAHDPWILLDEAGEFEEALKSNRVHIGKRSYGWRFLFDYNKWEYYDHTRESIMKFLESCFAVENEYGEPMTPDEFWNDYAMCNPDGYTGESYEREHGTTSSRGLAASRNYFESDSSPAGPIPKDSPYRFSNDTDFS